ncbi:hypothetical protein [Spiroplasma endosymbiont of Cleonymus obscurus]
MPSITEIVNIYYTQDLLKEREKNWMGYTLLDTNYVDKWTN